jgi:hypothetical protein
LERLYPRDRKYITSQSRCTLYRSGYVGHPHIRGRVRSRKADPRNADRDSDRSNIHHYSLRKCGPCSFASLMAEARVSVPRGLRAHLRIGTSIALLTHSLYSVLDHCRDAGSWQLTSVSRDDGGGACVRSPGGACLSRESSAAIASKLHAPSLGSRASAVRIRAIARAVIGTFTSPWCWWQVPARGYRRGSGRLAGCALRRLRSIAPAENMRIHSYIIALLLFLAVVAIVSS